MLHTYGPLSDGQLLQTYGFIDAALQPKGVASSPQGGDDAEPNDERSSGGGNPHNGVVLPLEELTAAAALVAGAARLWPAKRSKQVSNGGAATPAMPGLIHLPTPPHSHSFYR